MLKGVTEAYYRYNCSKHSRVATEEDNANSLPRSAISCFSLSPKSSVINPFAIYFNPLVTDAFNLLQKLKSRLITCFKCLLVGIAYR